ncbi:hypothetical protein NDU88_001281 [Pleurodeles waltl]|uniref:Uncharacterized protein n=1 Tax=Pleurodeles waltl TaxID=8319 RepID=A0AAV7VZL8_PLEWA|nr:hypothetical protein NDU88_001281 [Pleurodeles waltl]
MGPHKDTGLGVAGDEAVTPERNKTEPPRGTWPTGMVGWEATRPYRRWSDCSKVSPPGDPVPEEVDVRIARCQTRTSRLDDDGSGGCGGLVPLAPVLACHRLTGPSLADREQEQEDGHDVLMQEDLCREPPRPH